jgi:hypothetical protein
MRKLLISILLAGAAASPALAASNQDDRQQARDERAQAREERQQSRAESAPARANNARPNNAERPQVARPDFANRQAPQQQQQQQRQSFAGQQQQQFARQQRVQDLQLGREQRADQRQQAVEQLRDNRQLRQSTRATPNVLRNRAPVVSNQPRPGTQPPLRVRSNSQQPHWSTNWRQDGRYDWQNYRNRHRSQFHLSFYYDPFGWGYQPYQIGWRLWPSYYSSRFWINDPWQYRLPYSPPGTQWVRYYDDAVLVDTWSGQVVDVIYNFFW